MMFVAVMAGNIKEKTMQKIKSNVELLELNRAGRDIASLNEKSRRSYLMCREAVKVAPAWHRRAIDVLLGAVVVALIIYVVYASGLELARY